MHVTRGMLLLRVDVLVCGLSSCQNGVVPSRGPIEIDGIQVKEWQRLPKQLLNEYCQQQVLHRT